MLRAKVRGQWRIVSRAMARRFRARGIEVVDTDAVLIPFKVSPYEKVEFPAPAPLPPPAKPAAATPKSPTTPSPRQTVIRAPADRPAQIRPATAVASLAVKASKPDAELSLEELEKLTAPDPKVE